MRGPDIDYMREAPDAVVLFIEIDGFLSAFEQRLEFPHHRCVVLGVVERDVPDLRARL